MTSTPNFSICLIDMPAIVPIDPRDDQNAISFDPEDIAWEVRCAVEGGVDVVKTPYCGDVAAFHQIIENRPVPVVAAGARGAAVRRNVWSTQAANAFKSVYSGCKSAQEALRLARL